MATDIQCLENIDFIGGDKYICRIHQADIYIEPEFWDDENAETPVCEAINEQ